MSGRIPLRIEATIDALTDTAAAHQWAWAGDTALAAHGLLRWRDHRDVVTLVSPSDSFDPEAMAWALGHRSHLRTGMQLYHDRAVVPIDADGKQLTAVLRTVPTPAGSGLWGQLTGYAHPHRASSLQRTMSAEQTYRDIVDRWAASQFQLDTTIDALTLTDTIGPERFVARCDHLPGPVLDRARARLTMLAATPGAQLDMRLRPADQAAIRLAAPRLEEALHSRGVQR